MSVLRDDILDPDLKKEKNGIVITPRFNDFISKATFLPRTRSPKPAKSLMEFYGLVRQAILDMERREEVIDSAKIHYTAEDPDAEKEDRIVVSHSLVRRQPGAFQKGSPFEADVSNQRPILREEIVDPQHPGYKQAILGYFYDNEVKFSIFARTNAEANRRAEWFENIMLEYTWYFIKEGINRVAFLKRESDFTIENNGAKMYGRPVHYFVKTEKLITISQKTLEEIEIGLTAFDMKT